MTNAQIFLESVLEADHSVYGYALRPLSLFHLALLDEYAPAALTGACTRQELQLAALICSCSDSKSFYKLLRGTRGYLGVLYSHAKQVTKFQAYLEDYLTLPECNHGESKDNPFPYTLSLASGLIKVTGWSWEYVFYQLSVSQVLWLSGSIGYQETGETHVQSDRERTIYSML